MIKKIETSSIDLAPAANGYGIKFRVTLDNGKVVTVPMVWSTEDIENNTPKGISALFQTMVANAIDIISDDEIMQQLVAEFPADMPGVQVGGCHD